MGGAVDIDAGPGPGSSLARRLGRRGLPVALIARSPSAWSRWWPSWGPQGSARTPWPAMQVRPTRSPVRWDRPPSCSMGSR